MGNGVSKDVCLTENDDFLITMLVYWSTVLHNVQHGQKTLSFVNFLAEKCNEGHRGWVTLSRPKDPDVS